MTRRLSTRDPLTQESLSASLRLIVSEPLGAEPELTVVGPHTLGFESTGRVDRLATWRLAPVPEGVDGTYTFEVVLEDALGNRSLPLPLDEVAMVVDTQPPPAPLADVPDRIVYDRAPWGVSGGSPSFGVTGHEGAVTPRATVSLENTLGQIVSTAVADESGRFELVGLSDAPEVFVRQIDRAGNTGPRALVRDVAWTATLGGKVLGITFEDPHRFESTGASGEGLALPGSVDAQERAALPVADVSEPPWLPLEGNEATGDSPPWRFSPALAYDAARGVTVLFGGCGGSSGWTRCPAENYFSDTWEWDGATWMERTLATSPPARFSHSLAYDAARGVSVLFGGKGLGVGSCGVPGNKLCSDTWEWDGSTWTEVTPATSPPARAGGALAYDAARGVTVLFGGCDEASIFGECLVSSFSDTWEWDGTTWAEVTPATSPPARRFPALAYDAARGVTVLFGGFGTGVGACGTPDSDRCSDTWEWDGTNWTEVTPATSPPARWGHTLAFDAARGVTVLFGGLGTANGACGTPGSSRCSDTWEWNGTTWTQRTPVAAPPASSRHALAYDAARGVTVLFRGSGTWEWNGQTWTERLSPPGRSNLALAYDAARGVTVLFGGFGTTFGACGTPGSPSCSDTWEWNGSNWTQRTPATSPPARERHALAYDAARGVTVLFGGSGTADGACGTPGTNRCSDTWEWDGTTWTQRTPATRPPARSSNALAYDATRGVTVLFGGFGTEAGACGSAGSSRCSDTWEWDGATWTQRTSATSPPARSSHALAYDAARGVTVLFGGAGTANGACGTAGSQLCSDTWEWDGATWTQRTPATSPPARERPALAYDAARGVTVLFGGQGTGTGTCGTPGNNRCSDTWEWNGTSWTQRTPATSPPARDFHALAYDAARGVTVLFGGFGTEAGACGTPGSSRCSDTWLLPSDSTLSPRHTFSAAFAAALAPAATLRTATARWVAGGSGTPGGDYQEGAELLVWNGLGWTVLDAHAAGPDAPAALCTRLVADETAPPDPGCADLVDPVLVNNLFRFGPDLTSTFAVRPTAPIGTDEGELRSEDVAVTVRYRLPPE